MQFLYKLYIFIIFKKIFCIHSYKRKSEFYGSFKVILIFRQKYADYLQLSLFFRGPDLHAGLSGFLGPVHCRIRFPDKFFNRNRCFAMRSYAYGKGKIFKFLRD